MMKILSDRRLVPDMYKSIEPVGLFRHSLPNVLPWLWLIDHALSHRSTIVASGERREQDVQGMGPCRRS